MERARDRLERVLRGSRARARLRSRPGRPPGPGARCPDRRSTAPPRRAARAARRELPTPGSMTARCTPTGMYGSVLASTSAPCRICCGGIPCVTSMICVSGAICLITPWQVPTKSSWSPKSLRKVTNTRGGYRREQAGDVVRLRLGDNLDARVARGCRRLRPDADRRELDTEPPERPRRRGGGQHDEVALRRLGRLELARPVERRRRSRRAHRRAACARPRPPRRARVPPGAGSSASSPSWVETAGTRSAPPNASAVACADRGDPLRRARHPPPQLAAPFGARHDHPVVTADTSTGASPERLDLEQRAVDDVVPERLEAADELLLLALLAA